MVSQTTAKYHHKRLAQRESEGYSRSRSSSQLSESLPLQETTTASATETRNPQPNRMRPPSTERQSPGIATASATPIDGHGHWPSSGVMVTCFPKANVSTGSGQLRSARMPCGR